jgi:uncharacterized protein DUF4189
VKLVRLALVTSLAVPILVLRPAGIPIRSAEAKTYAVLAVVPGHGRVYHGYAKRDSLPKARAAALRKCAHKNCIVVQEYTTAQCAHLALGNDQIYWNNHRFRRSERARVLDECSRVDDKCTIIVSECIK